MSETLKLLTLILGSIQIIDIVISISLYIIYNKNKSYKSAIFMWLGMFLMFITDNILGTASYLHPFLSYSFAGISAVAMGQLISNHYGIKFCWKKTSLFFFSFYAFSLLLLAFGIRDFFILSLLISIGMTIPVIVISSKALRELTKGKSRGKSFIDKIFVTIILIWGVHFLDYPFLRPLESLEFSLFGFSFALILTYITSVLIPVVINQNIFYSLNDTLASKLDDKVVELKNAQDQILAREKLASLGALAAGIAHEIKNPLNIIKNGSVLMEKSSKKIMQIQHDLNLNSSSSLTKEELIQSLDKITSASSMIRRNADRADNIIKSMLIQSRDGERELTLENVHELIKEHFEFTMNSLPPEKSISLESEFIFNSEPNIRVYTQDFGRALINIFENSIFALNEKLKNQSYSPKITIETRDEGPYILVEITDNGVGIPAEIQSKILEPFFTTKAPGAGTGLGMSMVYDVAKLHEGYIDISSVENEFTKVDFKISKNLSVKK